MNAQSNDDNNGLSPRHVIYMPGQGTHVMISRAPFTQAAFDDLHLRRKEEDEKINKWQTMKDRCFCSKKRMWRLLTGYIPLIKVVRYYKLREYILSDILAGLSVGTMHLPMALAFGLLASTKIENGLFSSLWPSVVYILFGTSPHISMGTSAVICLLTASAVDREGKAWAATQPQIMAKVTSGTPLDQVPEYLDFKEEMAMSLSLIIGIILTVMGFLRLGFITSYLSDSFFAAFSSAAAIHIATTQLIPILGVTVPKFPGIFKLIDTFEAIFKVPSVNIAAIVISLICIFVIWFVKDCINERYKDRMFAPIPIEFFVVILGTIASYFGNFRGIFGIVVVGKIPLGIPVPKVPTVGLQQAPNFIGDAIIIAILNFAYTIAIAKICAKKHNYEIDDSQEMISYGLSNMASSFLRCIPSCVSPPRAMVASSMNARTTLSGIFSCIVMLIVIMVAASLFMELPKAVLGAIILISMKSLFVQIIDFWKYWCINKFDCLIWFCTFFSTVFLDIDIGLYIGVGVSVLTVVFQTQFARGYRLGYTKTDTTLVEHKKYKDSSEIPGIKVFRFQSNLYYANAEIFRSSLYRKSVNPRKLLKGLQKREKRLKKVNDELIAQGLLPKEDNNFIMTGEVEKSVSHISCPDLSTLSPPTINNNYPVSILKPTAGNGRHYLHSSPDLTSSDSEYETKYARPSFSPRPGLNGVKKVQLSGIDNPIFTVGSSNNILNMSEEYSVTKQRENGNLDKLKNSESLVSLYSISFEEYTEDPDDGDEIFTDEKLRHMRKIHHVIVDCSPINYMDASGINVLTHIYSEYKHVNIQLYLAGCSTSVRSTMKQAGVFDKIPEDNFFVHVHDAVSYARPQRPQPIRPENIQDFTDEEAIEDSPAVNV